MQRLFYWFACAMGTLVVCLGLITFGFLLYSGAEQTANKIGMADDLRFVSGVLRSGKKDVVARN